jgi:hypothetical protein
MNCQPLDTGPRKDNRAVCTATVDVTRYANKQQPIGGTNTATNIALATRTSRPKQAQLRVRRRSSSSILGTKEVSFSSLTTVTVPSSSTTTPTPTALTSELSSKSKSWLPDAPKLELNVSAGRVFYEKAGSRRTRHRDILRAYALQQEGRTDNVGPITTTTSSSNSSSRSCAIMPLHCRHRSTSITLGATKRSKIINSDLSSNNNDPYEPILEHIKNTKVKKLMDGWRQGVKMNILPTSSVRNKIKQPVCGRGAAAPTSNGKSRSNLVSTTTKSKKFSVPSKKATSIRTKIKPPR